MDRKVRPIADARSARSGARAYLLLAPALVVLGGLFVGGLAVGLLRSLGINLALGQTELSLASYETVLSDPLIYQSLGLSLWIAFASTLISAVLAVAAALILRRSFVGRGLATFLFQLNLTIPHLVGAIGVLYLFSQSGSFARIAAAAGLIGRPAEFPAIVYDPAAIGVILAYVWKEVPFIGVIVLANLRAIGTEHEAAARSLGASRWQVLRHVTLPMIGPGLLSASAIVFAFAFGAYEVPAMLGSSVPQALPVVAYRRFTDVDIAARPEALALGLLIGLISLALLLVYVLATRRSAS